MTAERAPEEGLRERVEALVVLEQAMSTGCDVHTPEVRCGCLVRRAHAILAASEAAPTAGEDEVKRAIRTLLPGLRFGNYVERWSPISPAIRALNILCEYVGEPIEPAGDEIDTHVPTAHHRRPAGDPATPPAAEPGAGDVEALSGLRPVTFNLGSRGPTEMVPLSDVAAREAEARRVGGVAALTEAADALLAAEPLREKRLSFQQRHTDAHMLRDRASRLARGDS